MHAKLKSFLQRWKKLEQTTKVLVMSFVIAGVVLAIAVALYARRPAPVETPQNDVLTPTYRHPLTGATLAAPLTDLPQVFGVMIENSSEAWPLTGLDEAFLVIEAPVEAAIPRFIAFFSEEATTEKIGPVRSARPYYLDWNDEFDGVYAHVGGSPEALDLIRSFGTLDLNEFFQGEYFYRDNGRFAPHNAYTTMEDLAASLEELQPDAPTYESWLWKDGEASGQLKSLSIDWTSGDNYDMAWTYDAERNAYQRFQGGTRYLLTGRTEVYADNVVVMASDIEVVDSTGRRHIRTTGSGDAIIAQDGRIIIGTWEKDTRTDRLRFFDDVGNEVQMNVGVTWVEVVASLGQVQVTETGVAE